MPDWTYTTTSSESIWDWGDDTITYAPSDAIQRMWEKHQQECDRQDREIEAQMQAEIELREDKRKYPLFFIKDGIV